MKRRKIFATNQQKKWGSYKVDAGQHIIFNKFGNESSRKSLHSLADYRVSPSLCDLIIFSISLLVMPHRATNIAKGGGM